MDFELAVLDDGFQDLSIKKINILCFNSSQPIGNAKQFHLDH